jgi:hypothetical protein
MTEWCMNVNTKTLTPFLNNRSEGCTVWNSFAHNGGNKFVLEVEIEGTLYYLSSMKDNKLKRETNSYYLTL